MANYNCRLCLFFSVRVVLGGAGWWWGRWGWRVPARGEMKWGGPSWCSWRGLHPGLGRGLAASHPGLAHANAQSEPRAGPVCFVWLLCFEPNCEFALCSPARVGTYACADGRREPFAKKRKVPGTPASRETGRGAVRPQRGDFTLGPRFKLWSNKTE